MTDKRDWTYHDEDDECPESNNGHEPDWNTLKVESDGGEYYIDVNCKLCGRSGCVGNTQTLANEISW